MAAVIRILLFALVASVAAPAFADSGGTAPAQAGPSPALFDFVRQNPACTNFTDNFVALLDSGFGAALNPSDKNIATPVSFPGLPFSVNLAKLDNGSFTQCVNGLIGCASSGAQPISTCIGTSQLIGTGMEVADPNACSAGQQVGGGTGWYVLRGNVVRGDIIELRLAIWDSGDHSYDSNVVLDNFRWSYQPAQAGGTLVPP